MTVINTNLCIGGPNDGNRLNPPPPAGHNTVVVRRPIPRLYDPPHARDVDDCVYEKTWLGAGEDTLTVWVPRLWDGVHILSRLIDGYRPAVRPIVAGVPGEGEKT